MQHQFHDPAYPLYDARWEHDACGTGFLAQISGEASYQLVQTALEALTRLTHRGAQDADAETSDGAGLLTQIPGALLCEELRAQGIVVADPADLAVGMLFLPSQDRAPADYLQSRQVIEQALNEAGLVSSQGQPLRWRDLPIDPSVLGARARATAPGIAQILLTRPSHLTREQYERSLYYARRLVSSAGRRQASMMPISSRFLAQQLSIKDCWLRISWRVSISTWRTLATQVPLLSFTSAIAPTRFPRGR